MIGIDPGLSGAFAALDAATGVLVALEDLPVIRSGRLGWIDAAELLPKLRELNGHGATTAIVERQGAMPRQGVASSFTIGVTFGSLLAALQAAALPVELVTAVQWKRALGLLKSDKRASLDRARLLFPTASLDRQKDHGRAEALLIAWWRLHRARATAEQRGADRP